MFKSTIILPGLLIIVAMVSNECARNGAMRVTSVEWRNAGSLPPLRTDAPHPGLAGALAGFHNNVLIIGGGANFPDSMPWLGGKKRYHDELYVFKRNAKDYEHLKGYRFTLPFPVAYGASCSTQEGVLYAGGENENGLVSTVMLIRYESGSSKIIIDRLPDLPYPVANGSVAGDGSKIYLAGGETTNGASDKLLCMELQRPETGWTVVTDLPHAVSHAVLLIAGDPGHRYLYLIGGRKRSASGISKFFASNFRFDLYANRWDERASLPYGLSAGTGYSTGSEIVLLGGDRGETFHATERLLAQISNEINPLKKDSLTRRKNQIQEKHPGFSREVLKYSVNEDKWIRIGQIPFDTPVTTTALRSGDFEVLIPGGEIRAGVRTPEIIQGTQSFDKKE